MTETADQQWREITTADRVAPRDGEPVAVQVHVSYRLEGGPNRYYAIAPGKRWPTGVGSIPAIPGWRDVAALSWRPLIERYKPIGG